MSEGAVSPQSPETIYLVASSGHANFGDEMVAAAWLRYLARQRPDADVVLDCGQPGVATHLFDGLHPHLKTTDILWRVVWDAMDLPRDEAAARVQHLIADLGTPGWDYGLLGARRATTIHLLGGGHISAHWPHHELLLLAGLALREVSGAQLFATGLGLADVANPEDVRTWLAGFDHATVRDEPSTALAGVRHVAEDTFLDLPNLPAFGARRPVDGEDGDVWVCLQHDLADEATFERIVEATRRLLSSEEYAGRPVHYIEAIPGGDRVAFERLADLIPEENFVPFVQLWGEPFPARPGQVWLTTRYHLHLLAAASGASGVAFEIDEGYYRVKHQSLADAGTGWTVMPADGREDPVPAWNPEFKLAAGRLHRAKTEEADGLYPRQLPPRQLTEESTSSQPTGRRFGRRR